MKPLFRLSSFFFLFLALLTNLGLAQQKLEELETLLCKNYATSILFSYFKLSKITPPQSLIRPGGKVAFKVIKEKGGVKSFLKASQCHIKVEEGASSFGYLRRLDDCLNSFIGNKPKEAKPHKEKFEKAISEALREVNQFFLKGPL